MLGSRRSSYRNCLVLAWLAQVRNLFGVAYLERFGWLAWLGLKFCLPLWVWYPWMWRMKTSLTLPLPYSWVYSAIASTFPLEYLRRTLPPFYSKQQALSPLSVLLPSSSLLISKSFHFYIERNFRYSVPVIDYLQRFSHAWPVFGVRC